MYQIILDGWQGFQSFAMGVVHVTVKPRWRSLSGLVDDRLRTMMLSDVVAWHRFVMSFLNSLGRIVVVRVYRYDGLFRRAANNKNIERRLDIVGLD